MVAEQISFKKHQYSISDKKWNRVKNFPDQLGWVYGAHEIADVFYIVQDNGIQNSNDELQKYDPTKKLTFCWSQSYTLGKKILVFTDDTSKSGTIKVFDTQTKRIIDKRIDLKIKCFDAVECLNRLWIVGGQETDDTVYNLVNKLKVYDPASQTASVINIKMLQARKDHKVVSYKEKLFVFGGSDVDGKNLCSVELFSLETKRFVDLAPMRVARSDFACCKAGSNVYVIGGMTDDGPTDTIEVYNLDTDTWEWGTKLPEEVNQPVHACALRNKLE